MGQAELLFVTLSGLTLDESKRPKTIAAGYQQRRPHLLRVVFGQVVLSCCHTRKQVLLEDRVDAPIAVDDLGDAKVDADRHQ